MKASIVVANYNNAKFVPDCINSINSQTYKNYEIIFFDDNSKDESINEIKRYKKIKIIRNKKKLTIIIQFQILLKSI